MNKTISGRPWDVFISYSSKDKLTADATCAHLEQRGIKCWIAPRDIAPGAEWADSILMGIASSRAMVLILSDSANQSVQVRREVERAVNKGVIIIPMRVEDILPVKSLEYFLSTSHWLDAYTPPLADHLERLAMTVRALVDPSKKVPLQVETGPISAPTPSKRKSLRLRVVAAATLLLTGLILYFSTSHRPASAVEELFDAQLKTTDELQNSLDTARGNIEQQRSAVRAAGVALAVLDPTSCPPDFRDAFLRNRQAFDQVRSRVEIESADSLRLFFDASLNRIGVDLMSPAGGLQGPLLTASRQYQMASAQLELAASQQGLLPKRVISDVRVITLNDTSGSTGKHWQLALQDYQMKPGSYEFAFSALALDAGTFDMGLFDQWSHDDKGGGYLAKKAGKENVSYGIISHPLNLEPLPTDPQKARFASTYFFTIESKSSAPCRIRTWLRATRLD